MSTTPLKKIIVCLDHSEKDVDLIQNAANISKVAGATHFIFLNVIKEFHLPDSMLKEFPNLIDKALDEREREINEQVAQHFDSQLSTEVLVLQGNVEKEILKVATQEKTDLIIIGKTPKSEAVLSGRIARKSPCNLLFIPRGEKVKFDKIFIPVDFSDYSLLSLQRTLLLTENQDSKIYLQNVYQVPSSYRYSGKSFEEFAEVMKGHAQKDLESLLRQVKHNHQELIPLYSLGKSGKVIELILKEAKKKEVDMIVMGAKGRTTTSAIFIGSKAERMIRSNSDIPLMIIRKKGALAGIFETLKEL